MKRNNKGPHLDGQLLPLAAPALPAAVSGGWRMTGAKTAVPACAGLLVGCLLALLLSPPPSSSPTTSSLDSIDPFAIHGLPAPDSPNGVTCPPQIPTIHEPINAAEHWIVRQEERPPRQEGDQPAVKRDPVVQRTRFAATELGVRERLLVLVWAESGGLAVALNASLSRHIAHVVALADTTRLDLDQAALPGLIQLRPSGLHAHTQILNAVFNHTWQEHFDWFLFVRESTYINPFALQRLVDQISWHEKVVLGSPQLDGSGRCSLDGGVLLSNPAMQMLIQQRHACNSLLGESEQLNMELCIHAATNVSCRSDAEGHRYDHWSVKGGLAAHDALSEWLAFSPSFNSSLSVGPILSEADTRALHDHFVSVEIDRVDAEISSLEEEVFLQTPDSVEGPTWPIGINSYAKPPNRYQVPVWEFFTPNDIFKNEPNMNVRTLEGSDKEDVDEVVAEARNKVETDDANGVLEFLQMRNGYRIFDARRGMDYIVDLEYLDKRTDEQVERRVHVSRAIVDTRLLNQVPYVKEDSDLTIIVPVAEEKEVLPARRLLARHVRLCNVANEESRHTRLVSPIFTQSAMRCTQVVAVSSRISARSSAFIGNDLEELRKRLCKRSGLETSLLVVAESSSLFPAEALDEAVDHFGPQSMFLLLSPHADIQHELLDRARINTIKHYQIFLPIPFIEYHPTISKMDHTDDDKVKEAAEFTREAMLARVRDSNHEVVRKKVLLVQKDHGRFDPMDFSVACIYGSDYMAVRDKLLGPDAPNHLDVGAAFIGLQDVHVLRAVEPALRLRYHPRSCESELTPEDLARCSTSRRENLASKDEMANMLFTPEM